MENQIRLVAWESTKKCNLSCIHCRANAKSIDYDNELKTEEVFKLIDEIRELGQAIFIITGGEPLLREDIWEIAKYGDKQGLRMVMAPNGTLITKENAKKMIDSGIQRISVSLDGSNSKTHNAFRGVEGAFEAAIEGIKIAKDAGMKFQINTTVSKDNLNEIPKILKVAEDLGAEAHHIFLLVPTGRGKYITDNQIDAIEYEKTLHWFYEQQKKTKLQLKATCAPHYYRILRQRAKAEKKEVTFQSFGLDAVTRGCLGGISFCFVSNVGVVQPCGFLELDCGNIREKSFTEIWKNSEHFKKLRDYDALEGKCKVCKYKNFCGGCRARAFEKTGNYMAEEPLCLYNPSKTKN